jgi:hypothetical protein
MAFRMGSVRVVMMQKDEGEWLTRWLSHYGGLFGFENLTILDNGSQDAYTISLLREAEKQGTVVNWSLNSPNDFHHKGEHVRDVITSWDYRFDYNFALPVDCDEILAVFTDQGLTTNHDAIRAEMERLKPVTNALRVDLSLFNVPERPGWYAPHRSFYKGFLPRRSIEFIDDGFHTPASRLARGFTVTRFAYLHWHNRPFNTAVAMAKDKLRGLVDVDDPDALRAYAATPGARMVHVIDMLLMTAQDYEGRYDDEVQVYVPPDGAANLLRVGGEVSIWNAERYLIRNQDVVGYGFPCLHHFLRYGYLEKRLLRSPRV